MFCCTSILVFGREELVALVSLFHLLHGCCVALPRDAMGLSAVCDCGWYFLTILTYYIKYASFAFPFSCYSYQACFLSLRRISFLKIFLVLTVESLSLLYLLFMFLEMLH